ncbi:hypothetical protein C9374_004397 [Naegleria lovaniensis]|uniref:Uncharacterized protein n=1 Tax=Naegleria lovaniensis TaxID=51637 RepID=A0AA88KKZ1_NAELO|nr:uncharacterized protein C9374_004397 [Naegleria lovaniensis]KAG2383060.1 hypothetical protein C9374_004397 [Naegleria lovaniensis]
MMKTPSKAKILSSPTHHQTALSEGVKSPQPQQPRFLSPTASSSARRKEILSARGQQQQQNHHQPTTTTTTTTNSTPHNPLVTPPRHAHSKLPSFSSSSSSTHSVPSKRGTLLYDPLLFSAPSTAASTKSSSGRVPSQAIATTTTPNRNNYHYYPNGQKLNHDDDENSLTVPTLHSPRSKGILKSPPPPPIQLIPEVYRDACTNLHTLGICSPSASRFFSPYSSFASVITGSSSHPQQQQQPFYKKQGKFGTLILQTSLSKLTKGILLDKEEYLTIGCYRECNIRVNHRCFLKLDPDYDEQGNPCMFLCVYEGANLIKLNGEVLEGLWDDEDMDGILLKHDDEIRIVDKLLYYENYEQYERERRLSLLNDVVATLPLFNKENVIPELPTTPNKNNQKAMNTASCGLKGQQQQQPSTSSQMAPPVVIVADQEMKSPPINKGFSSYVDTPKRKDSIQKKSISTQRKSTTPYSFHVDAVHVGSVTVATNSSLLFDCGPATENSNNKPSLDHQGLNNHGMTSSLCNSARKSVSFGETIDIQYYKPSHEPKRVSAANRLVIDEDLVTTSSSQTTDDSTISFGCDNDTTSHADDLTLTQNNITSLSNICQIIHIQGDQQCTVQPVLESAKPPTTTPFPVLDVDVDLLLQEFAIPKPPHTVYQDDVKNDEDNMNEMEHSQSVQDHVVMEKEIQSENFNLERHDDNALHNDDMMEQDVDPIIPQTTESQSVLFEDEDSLDAIPTPHSGSSRGSSQRKRSTPVTEESESDGSLSSASSTRSFFGEDDESFLNMNFYAPPRMNVTSSLFERTSEEVLEHVDERIELTHDDHLDSSMIENEKTLNGSAQESVVEQQQLNTICNTPPRQQTAKRGRDDEDSNSNSPSMRTPSCSAEKDTKKTKECVSDMEAEPLLASSVNRTLEFELPNTFESCVLDETVQTTTSPLKSIEVSHSPQEDVSNQTQEEIVTPTTEESNALQDEVVDVVLKKKSIRRRRAKKESSSSVEDEEQTKPSNNISTSPEASVTQVPRRNRKLKK